MLIAVFVGTNDVTCGGFNAKRMARYHPAVLSFV